MKENSSPNIIQTIVVVLVIVAAVFAGMSSLARPAVVPASAPADEFSAERAMEHIRAIFQEPHPVGSPGNAQARDYIIAQLEGLGLAPEVQQTTALIPSRGNVQASIVHNIIVKIPGTNSSEAILLDAHYDTMPMTPGASDCGSCVATLLETARALQAGSPPQNDVIFLFTDNEEYGPASGAAAFVDEHPQFDGFTRVDGNPRHFRRPGLYVGERRRPGIVDTNGAFPRALAPVSLCVAALPIEDDARHFFRVGRPQRKVACDDATLRCGS